MTPELRVAIAERLKEFEPELSHADREYGLAAMDHRIDLRTLFQFFHFDAQNKPCVGCGRPRIPASEVYRSHAEGCSVVAAYNRIFTAFH
jgi:hypothetical protein